MYYVSVHVHACVSECMHIQMLPWTDCVSNHLHVWNFDSTERPSVKLDAVQHKCIFPSSSTTPVDSLLFSLFNVLQMVRNVTLNAIFELKFKSWFQLVD